MHEKAPVPFLREAVAEISLDDPQCRRGGGTRSTTTYDAAGNERHEKTPVAFLQQAVAESSLDGAGRWLATAYSAKVAACKRHNHGSRLPIVKLAA
jgi:hypothetical protein